MGQIQDLGRQLDAGKAGVTMEVMNFLTEWLQKHIMKVDRHYLPLLKGKKPVKQPGRHGVAAIANGSAKAAALNRGKCC